MGRFGVGLVFGVWVLLVFVAVFGVVLNVPLVKGDSGTIYIRADGRIDPPTAAIQRDGDVYTFTNCINGSVFIERDNIVVDGVGHSLQGALSGTGILLSGRANVTIKNVEIRKFESGIQLDFSSSSNSLLENNIIDNGRGIQLAHSSNNNTISRNNVINNSNGICLYSCSNNTLRDNKVANSSFNGIWLYRSSDNTVFRNRILNCSMQWDGSIKSISSSGNRIFENNITHNSIGAYLFDSSNNSITGNNMTESVEWGIWLSASSNNSVSGNSVTNNVIGINLLRSSENSIVRNNVTDNNIGIALDSSSNNNSISNNDIRKNDWYGIWLSSSSHNLIYHNNLVSNFGQIYTEDTMNDWSCECVFEGNYWSDCVGVDLNNDGIADTPYVIDDNNKDNHPLMGMFSSFNTSLGHYADIISNSTIEDFQYFESNSTITIHVSNMTTGQSFGFCRIRIPHALMNETYHVTVDGGEPYFVNYTLLDDGDSRWIYFSYKHSTLEISIVPEFSSFLILQLLVTTTALTAAIYRKKPKS